MEMNSRHKLLLLRAKYFLPLTRSISSSRPLPIPHTHHTASHEPAPIPEHTTTPLLPVIPDESHFELTKEEVAHITDSPFLRSIKVADPRSKIPSHVRATSQYVPFDNGYLKTMRFPDAPTPFEVYTSPMNSAQASRISNFPRLSVTRLLTQQWCELRNYYETYSQIPLVETDAMKRGKETHLELELLTHPLVDTARALVAIPQKEMTKEDEFCDMLRNNVLRLVQLFAQGTAREVYVHGYINEDGFVKGRKPNATDTVVTGIIDYLVLRCRDREHPIQRELKLCVDDIDIFMKTVRSLVDEYKDLYVLSVCDVKTRKWRKVPTQTSVVEGSKQQVIIYEEMMKLIGESEVRCVQFWEEYCHRKGIDVDKPVTPELALVWITINDILVPDFRRLRDGELDGMGSDPAVQYSFHKFKEEITDDEVLVSINEFLVPWSQALTPRYFIHRLSQLMHLTAQFHGGDTRIQYYSGTEMFKELRFRSKEGTADGVAKDALGFWMGTRPPKLMEKTYSNMRQKCNFCEYSEFCGWKKETEDQFNDRPDQAYRSA